MKKKISIIIPAYNSELTLSRCLNSLVEQTNKDFEVVIVDDGSIDKTYEIISSFFLKLDIRYYYQKNSGVSAARNLGIEMSNSEYLCFLDADDYYEPNFIEEFLLAINPKYDIYIGEYNVIGNNKFYNDKYILNNLPIEGECSIIIENMIKLHNKIIGNIWRCLFKKDIIQKNNIYFENIRFGEDNLFLIRYLSASKFYFVIKRQIYNYVVNDLSVTNNYIANLDRDLLYRKEEVIKLLRPLKIKNINEKIYLCSSIPVIFRNECRSNKKIKEIRLHIRKLYNKNKLKFYELRYFSFFDKIILLSIKLHIDFLLINYFKFKNRN